MAKSAEATSLNSSKVEAQVTHSSTGRARGLLRRRMKVNDEISKLPPRDEPSWMAFGSSLKSLDNLGASDIVKIRVFEKLRLLLKLAKNSK